MADFLVSPFFERPPAPNAAWWKGALGAQLWDAFLTAGILAAQVNCSYLPPSGPQLDVRAHTTAPNQSWWQVPDGLLNAPFLAAINDGERNNSYRSTDGPHLVLGIHDTAPSFSWLQVPANLFNTPFVIAIDDATRNTSYRSLPGPLLQFGIHDTAPWFSWFISPLYPPSSVCIDGEITTTWTSGAVTCIAIGGLIVAKTIQGMVTEC